MRTMNPGARNGRNSTTLLVRAIAAGVGLAMAASNVRAANFTDDFNRPDSSSVGNGWTDCTGNFPSNLSVRENDLSGYAPVGSVGGFEGICRPFVFSQPVTISATLKETYGSNGPQRYAASFSLGNNGSVFNGYGINFGRSDIGWNNSKITLFDGDGHLDNLTNVLASVSVPFQFGSSIKTEFTISSNGRVSGYVSQGSQRFDFALSPANGAYTIKSVGSNFAFSTETGDPARGSYARMDDFSIRHSDAVPVTVTPGTPPTNPGGGVIPTSATLSGNLMHWNGTSWDKITSTSTSQLSQTERDKPILLLTHGWHGEINGDADFAALARQATAGYDVLAWDWREMADPFNYGTGWFAVARDFKNFGVQGAAIAANNGAIEGAVLAKQLKLLDLSPVDMHLVGHSDGAAVVGNAAKWLRYYYPGEKVDTITLLDAPKLTVNGIPVNAQKFVDNNSAERLENYYSSDRIALGFGAKYEGTGGNIWNGEMVSSGSPTIQHLRIKEWYATKNPNLLALSHGDYSEQGLDTGNFDPNSAPPELINETTPNTILDFNDGSTWFGQHAEPVMQPDGEYAMRVFENSDGYLFKTLSIPADAYYMTFDYKIDAVGDGDYLSLSFDDNLLSLLDLGATNIDFATTDPIYVGNLSGLNGNLLFALNSEGSVNASLLLDNITFYSVPEPSSLTLGLAGLLLLRRTRHSRAR